MFIKNKLNECMAITLSFLFFTYYFTTFFQSISIQINPFLVKLVKKIKKAKKINPFLVKLVQDFGIF